MMMKNILAFALLITTTIAAFGQNYFTKSGHVWFHSEAPMETIEAHNHQVTSILNTENGEMVFKVLMKSFQFEKAKMQEHFNEKYVESDKFPESVFKGKITNLEKVDFTTDGKYNVTVEGEMTIHGVTHTIKTDGTLEIKDGKIEGFAKFPVEMGVYEIKIPGTVKDNIAKVVDITIEMAYEPMGG